MEQIRCTKYLRFFLISMNPKTMTYEVLSINQGLRLAIIKWYGPWRQYCFYPEANTVWNVGCLQDINKFINDLMAERRMKKNEADSKEENDI